MIVKWLHRGAKQLLSNWPSSEGIKDGGGDRLEVTMALASVAKEKDEYVLQIGQSA